jgi:hypothetical protein
MSSKKSFWYQIEEILHSSSFIHPATHHLATYSITTDWASSLCKAVIISHVPTFMKLQYWIKDSVTDRPQDSRKETWLAYHFKVFLLYSFLSSDGNWF